MTDIDIRAIVQETEKGLFKYERAAIPKATNRALNRTMGNVQTAIVRKLAEITALKQKEIKPGLKVTKSTFSTLNTKLIAFGRAPNLIRFVVASKQHVGAFKKQLGVRAGAWGSRNKLYKGAFIIRGKGHGKPIVVAREGRERQPLKGLPGPSIRSEFNKPEQRALMERIGRDRFLINFQADLNFYVSRIK